LGPRKARPAFDLAGLASGLSLSRSQHELFERFAGEIARSREASAPPDADDGWQSDGAVDDALLHLEIAAGRFLGAIERAREAFAAFHASLSARQRRQLEDLVRRRWS
jgi:hypothetical protein